MNPEEQGEREQDIADALAGVLDEGERWLVACRSGRIDVRPAEAASLKPFSEEQPDLYGYLLAVNEVLSEAGTGFVMTSMFVVAAICLAVHMEWIDRLLRIEIERLQSVWVYAFALAATFFGSGQVALWIESMAYRRHREELLRAIRSSGFTLKRLLARIAGDGQLGKVAERLKTESARRDSSDPAC